MHKFDSAPESLQIRAKIQLHLAEAQDARLAARLGDHDALETAAYHDNQVSLLRHRLRSMGLRPNPTDKRLFKSLERFDKFPPDEREGLRLALIEIVFNSIGIDHYDRRATSDELLEEYGKDERLRKKSVIDGAVPWLATRLAKERFANQREADATLDALRRRFRALSTWATETRQNLASMSLRDALEESQGYQSFAQQKGKAESDVNPTLYRFAGWRDGWKVVELRTEKALEREGDLMDHCVGGYYEQVKSGESRIFSLRDPDNKPRVTMEYSPEEKRFKQIYGPSNEAPEPNLYPYLSEFIEEKFDGNPDALLQVGLAPSQLDLRGADLRGVDFQGEDLRGEDLRGADLEGANLEGARLQEANLQEAKLQDAILQEANLADAALYDANLQGAILQEANLEDAALRGANLRKADLQEANLEDANLEDADLREADLREADLRKANLRGADLEGADLREADLREADLREADLRKANLQGAILQEANLQGAKLQFADLQEANLQGAKLQFADLRKADLLEAKLQDAILQEANLADAALYDANLQGAILQEANLQGAKLQFADLQGALYDDGTQWPDDFDPEAAGAIYED